MVEDGELSAPYVDTRGLNPRRAREAYNRWVDAKKGFEPISRGRVDFRKLECRGHEPLTPSEIDARNGFASLSVSTEHSFKWVDAKKGFEPMS